VLIVDDESLIRWSLRTAFQERGHSVTTAGTGTEALAALAATGGAFDVVLLDYRLPDRQDLSLLDDIKRLSPRSVVFMMTAFADEGMRSQAIGHGARQVMDKPFQITAVVALAESASAS
jgi:DNA-binding NtrC family response regulator